MHRDVKPSNILIGEQDFAYLIDFGIARAANDTGMTSTGAVIGTWAYLAPERITGQADHRADIYALTCVLHECLTGQQPYPGNTIEQQIGGHLRLPPPQPSAVRQGVPTPFDEIIATGMAKNPDDRYPSTTELAQATRSAAAAPPPRPAPPTPPAPPPAWHTQPPTYQQPMAGGSARPFTRQPQPPYAPPSPQGPWGQPHPPNRSPMRPGVLVAAILAVIVFVAGIVLAVTQPWKSTDSKTTTASGPTTPPKPAGPTFDGTFTATYGPQTKFNGTPIDEVVKPTTWVVRSACDRNGCVAAATTVDRPGGVLTRTFDYVDDQWVAVIDEPGRNTCKNVNAQRWERTTLKPRTDGSMSGDTSAMFDNGCSSRSSVTYSRTGDGDSEVATADLGAVTARVASPARGLHGRYHSVQQYTTGKKTVFESDYDGETFCVRTGDRCLTYLYDMDGGYSLKFAAGQWIQSLTRDDGKCTNGTARHDEFTTIYPLPQSPQDPIQVLVGRGENKYSGGCTGVKPFDHTFTRTGN